MSNLMTNMGGVSGEAQQAGGESAPQAAAAAPPPPTIPPFGTPPAGMDFASLFQA